MSNETAEWLNNNTLIGMTDKRGQAWHRDLSLVIGDLDNHYPQAIPAEDILSRLFNFTAEEQTLYIETPLGMLPVDGKKAIVHSETGHVFGIHGAGYKVHPYGEWLVNNLNTLVNGNANYANAGLLDNGARAWVQIETPDNITTRGGVEFRPSILAYTSLDGSLATGIKPVVTNVVCDNTMAGALGEDGPVYRLKHTRKSAFILADARAAIDMIEATAQQVAAEIDRLTDIEVSDKMWSEFIAEHAPIEAGAKGRGVTMMENKRTALTGLWRTDIRVAPWHGTAWGVVQAVNTYNEHMATMRGDATRFERKLTRAIGDDVRDADKMTIAQLGKVMHRELLAV